MQNDEIRRRLVPLVVLCTGMLMIILDTTIVSVALPTIRDDLGLSAPDLAWVVNAYLIPFGGLLLLAGRLGDLLGRRRMFLGGLAVFTVASLLCGLAPTGRALIAARFLQGVGGAFTSAVILGMIVALVPEPRAQRRAIGAYAFVGAAGASLGLVLGGVLTQAVGWHWIFVVNVPIGVGTLVTAVRVLAPDAGLGLAHGSDVPGAVLVVGALVLGVSAVVGVPDHGWTAARTLVLGVAALVLLGAFAAREARAPQPLVAPAVLRVRTVAAANVVQLLMISGIFAQQFFVALYLQEVLGWDAVGVGLGMVPIALVIGLVSLGVAARLADRVGARRTLATGLVAMAAGLVLLTRVPVSGSYASDVLPALVLMGIGAGLALPGVTTVAMAGVAPADAGLASGLVNTTQQVGAALGLAVLTTLAATRTQDRLAAGAGDAAALAGGYGLAFAAAAGFVVAALVATVVLVPADDPSDGGDDGDDEDGGDEDGREEVGEPVADASSSGSTPREAIGCGPAT